MVVIKVITNCGGDPIRLVCFNSGLLSNAISVIVCDDDAFSEFPSYELHVTCTEACIDRILDIASFQQDFSDTEGSRIPLTKDGESLCVKGENCTLARLSIQELLIPLCIDELQPNQRTVASHGYYQ